MLTTSGKEWLKWLALLAMTADHVDKVFFAGQLPALSAFGRLAFPIFAVVLVDNLVGRDKATVARAMSRLLLAGLIVQPAYMVAFDRVLPVNTLLTLALGIYLCSEHRMLPFVVVSALGGFFVDYQWPGLVVMLAAATWSKCEGGPLAWGFLTAALGWLCWQNGNAWALATLPLLWLATRTPGTLPRWRWLFLGYYVAHVAGLAVWRLAVGV